MVDKELRERIIAMIHREVVPAIGCTEPMCSIVYGEGYREVGLPSREYRGIAECEYLEECYGCRHPWNGNAWPAYCHRLGSHHRQVCQFVGRYRL